MRWLHHDERTNNMPDLIKRLIKENEPSVDTYYTLSDERSHLTIYNSEGNYPSTGSNYLTLSASAVPSYYEYVISSSYNANLINYWPMFDSPNTALSASNKVIGGDPLQRIGTPTFCTTPVFGTTTIKDIFPVVDFVAASSQALSGSTLMANIPSGSSRTYILLFRPDVSNVTYTIFGTGGFTNQWRVQRISTSDRIAVYVSDGTNTISNTYTSLGTNTNYYHLAVVFERTGSQDTRVYMQGGELTPKVAVTDMGEISSSVNFQVARNSDGTNYFDGKMSHLQIYDTALTKNQILENYSSSAYLILQ